MVTEAAELEQAANELASSEPSDYVVFRVSESSFDNGNRANSLRQLIEHGGLIARPPTTGEREALERGLDALGIQHGASGRTRPPRRDQ